MHVWFAVTGGSRSRRSTRYVGFYQYLITKHGLQTPSIVPNRSPECPRSIMGLHYGQKGKVIQFCKGYNFFFFFFFCGAWWMCFRSFCQRLLSMFWPINPRLTAFFLRGVLTIGCVTKRGARSLPAAEIAVEQLILLLFRTQVNGCTIRFLWMDRGIALSNNCFYCYLGHRWMDAQFVSCEWIEGLRCRTIAFIVIRTQVNGCIICFLWNG